jgi:hypothetical protein
MTAGEEVTARFWLAFTARMAEFTERHPPTRRDAATEMKQKAEKGAPR